LLRRGQKPGVCLQGTENRRRGHAEKYRHTRRVAQARKAAARTSPPRGMAAQRVAGR
jgi:hypothetical protein